MKLVVGQVLIEGANHPISPGPHKPIAIDLIAVRVAVTSDVQPFAGQAFAVAVGTEQPIDQTLVGVFARS